MEEPYAPPEATAVMQGGQSDDSSIRHYMTQLGPEMSVPESEAGGGYSSKEIWVV